MSDIKKIGIVADNYKVRKFKRLLTAAGYEFKTEKFTSQATAFFINTTEDQVRNIGKICKKVQIDATQSN